MVLSPVDTPMFVGGKGELRENTKILNRKLKYMEKAVRVWYKQEKRIVRLMYQKGLIDDFKLSELYWERYKLTEKKMGRKPRKKYVFTTHYPEIHFCTVDYWG